MRLDEATHLFEDVLTDAKRIYPNLVIGRFGDGSVGFFDNKNDSIVMLAPAIHTLNSDKKSAAHTIEYLAVLVEGCFTFGAIYSKDNIVGKVPLGYKDVYGKFKSTIKEEIIELIKKRHDGKKQGIQTDMVGLV